MKFRPLLAGLVCIALTGCGALPRGAAQQSEILRSAAADEITIYQVSRALLPSVATWPRLGPKRPGWVGHSHGANTQVVRPGDTLQIRVWDSSENSLLTSSGQRSTALDPMRVTASGQIFLPYVGPVRVADAPPEQARARVERAFESISPTVQVQLSMQEGRSNTVDLVGGAARPGSYPLPNQNFSVLGLLAAGGGVQNGLKNPQIRLRRGHRSYVTSIDLLYDDPRRDTRLQPGDQVIIEEDPRYFLSLGATGSEALHPFTRDRLTAMDAVSIIGGVNDTRADLDGVLVLREYPATALAPGTRGPQTERVIFTMDLSTADGLFSARNFEIMDRDLVFASESPVTMLNTILAILGTTGGFINRIDDLSN